MARIYVGGSGGSGKTAICKLIAERLNIPVLTGSEIMMRAAGLSSREDLAKLSEEEKQRLRDSAFEACYQSAPELVIEGHFFLTGKDVRYLDAYILIETDEERLVEFRKNDSNRARSLDIEEIRKETLKMEGRISNLETEHGIRVIRIKNDGDLEDLAESVEVVYLSLGSRETRAEMDHRGVERL